MHDRAPSSEHPADVPAPDHLDRLAATLQELDLRLAGESAEEARVRAATLCADYLAPRLRAPTDPLVVAVIGPSGSGKSTILNSLAGRRIAETGPIRPTTIQPLAWAAGTMPANLDAIRRRLPGAIVDTLRPPPDGAVLVDCPPPEVTDGEGRAIVRELIDVADAVVLVASATRYADAQTFDLLERAARRDLSMVLVLNRLPERPEDQAAIASDFASKLSLRRLVSRSDPELVATIGETDLVGGTGVLRPEEVARVGKEIEALADPQSRPDVAGSAVAGSLRLLRADLAVVRAAVIRAEARRVEMLDPMRAVYREQSQRLAGEVRAGRFAGETAENALSAMAVAASRRAGMAALDAAEHWREAFPHLIDSNPELYGPDPHTRDGAREHLEFWVSEIGALVDQRTIRRLSRRRRRAVVSHVFEAALDPRSRPRKRLARALRRVPGVVAAARDLLSHELTGVLEADSQRFVERLGPPPPEGILAELVVER